MPAKAYHDRLSLRSLAVDDRWPKWGFSHFHLLSDRTVLKDLKKLRFDFNAWLEYKSTIPHNQPDLRTITYPGIEYKLTPAEYQALVTKIKVYPSGWYGPYKVADFTSPVVCPEQWATEARQCGEFPQRQNWLLAQMFWVEESYPMPPTILWRSNGLFLQIFQRLVYDPFIKWWGEPPDDFWVQLSYCNNEDNWHSLNRGLILVFEAQGRIYPSPYVYGQFESEENTVESHDSDSMLLPAEFWVWTPPPREVTTAGVPFGDLTLSEQILVRLMGEQLSDHGYISLDSLVETLRIAGILEQLRPILQSFHQKGYITVQMDDEPISDDVKITYHGFREYITHFLPFFPLLRQRVISQLLERWRWNVHSLSESMQLSPFAINHIFEDLEQMGYLHTFVYPFGGKREISYIFPALWQYKQNHPLPLQYQSPTVLLGAAPGAPLDIEERVIQEYLLGHTLKYHHKIRLPDQYALPSRGPAGYQVVAIVPDADLIPVTEETRIEVVPSVLINWEFSTPYSIDLN